ncbi:MAG: arabinose efflux permease family protein [Ilumatobacteraceae bacterium]|nr:arabinose efflux permease family protein [Ilumatobacteraceae bacterium]
MTSPSLAPFKSRDYSLIWAGALVSNIGTWMETVALSYYVAHTTGKASWSAIVAAAAFVPGAIVGPIGSAMADRLRRRRVLITTNSISAVIAAFVAVWVGSGHATPLGLACLGFIGGTVFAFGFPSFQTSLPDLVPREHLVAAVGLSNAQWNLGRVIGPALAALAIAIGGIQLALWCNAISFVAVIMAVSSVRLPRRHGERRPVFAALGDGLHFARTTPAMRRMLVVMVVVIGFGSPFIAFVSQMATNVFHGDSTATSVLVMAQGAGAVTAAFTLGSVTQRFGSWRVMVGAASAFAIALVLYGAAPQLWIAAIAISLIGVSYGYAFTSMAGIAQQNAPDAMRGRVLAVNSFVLGVLYPLGTVVQGAFADVTSLRTVTVSSGVCLAGSLVLLHLFDRRRRARTTPIAGGDAPMSVAVGR